MDARAPSHFRHERYELLAPLGEGGMGGVWRALDRRLKREVALKFLKDEWTGDHDARARFVREARALARADHPGIVRIFDVGDDARTPWFAQELLAGETLYERVSSPRGPLAPDDGRRLVLELADALAHLHGLRLLHRDLKPQNVFLQADGRARIVDFGLALDLELTRMTDVDCMVGTLSWVPPEVINGGTATPRSDVYQVGLLLWYALTGSTPDVPAAAGRLDLDRRSDLGTPTEAPPQGLPEDLREVLARCCAKRPEARYADGGALLAALRLRPVVEHAAAPAAPPLKVVRGGSHLWAAVIAAALPVALMTAVLWHREAPPAAEPPALPPLHRPRPPVVTARPEPGAYPCFSPPAVWAKAQLSVRGLVPRTDGVSVLYQQGFVASLDVVPTASGPALALVSTQELLAVTGSAKALPSDLPLVAWDDGGRACAAQGGHRGWCWRQDPPWVAWPLPRGLQAPRPVTGAAHPLLAGHDLGGRRLRFVAPGPPPRELLAAAGAPVCSLVVEALGWGPRVVIVGWHDGQYAVHVLTPDGDGFAPGWTFPVPGAFRARELVRENVVAVAPLAGPSALLVAAGGRVWLLPPEGPGVGAAGEGFPIPGDASSFALPLGDGGLLTAGKVAGSPGLPFLAKLEARLLRVEVQPNGGLSLTQAGATLPLGAAAEVQFHAPPPLKRGRAFVVAINDEVIVVDDRMLAVQARFTCPRPLERLAALGATVFAFCDDGTACRLELP